jgi:hypothetical protein
MFMGWDRGGNGVEAMTRQPDNPTTKYSSTAAMLAGAEVNAA